jgi:hypothetical protein
MPPPPVQLLSQCHTSTYFLLKCMPALMGHAFVIRTFSPQRECSMPIPSLWHVNFRRGTHVVDQVVTSPYTLPADIFEVTQRKALHGALRLFKKQSCRDEYGQYFPFRTNHYLRNVERCTEPGREDTSALLSRVQPCTQTSLLQGCRPDIGLWLE